MKLKLHDLIYLACLYSQKGIVEDIIEHQQRRGEFNVSFMFLFYHDHYLIPLLFTNNKITDKIRKVVFGGPKPTKCFFSPGR